MTRRLPPRKRSRFTRSRWALSIAVALGLIGFVGAAQWNSSLARQVFVTSAQAVLITEAEQAQREQERLRDEITEAEARVRSFQERNAGSQTAQERLNQQLLRIHDASLTPPDQPRDNRQLCHIPQSAPAVA